MAPVWEAGRQYKGIGRTVCHCFHCLVPIHLNACIVIPVAKTCGELDHATGVCQGRSARWTIIYGLASKIVPAFDA